MPDPPRFHDAFARRCRIEAVALYLTFRFHDGNNHIRKALTLMLVTVWGIVTIGLTFEGIQTVEPPFYGILTAIVFLIVGRMWDIEVENFTNATIRTEDGDE